MGLAKQINEAVKDLGGELSDADLARFLEAHPVIFEGLEGGLQIEDVMSLLDTMAEFNSGHVQASEALDSIFNVIAEVSVHNPFRNKKSIKHDCAVTGMPNPRSEVNKWKNCSCSNYVCTCTGPNGKEKTINMTKYYGAKKKRYMAIWRDAEKAGRHD